MFFEDIPMEKEWVIERKTGKFTEHELHMHDVLELHVLKENEALFRLSDKEYEGRPGDIFLFRPFEAHWNLNKHADSPIQWISILFTPSVVRMIPGGCKLLAPFYAVEAVSPLIPANTACAREIQRIAELACLVEEEHKTGWESRQFVFLLDILNNLFTHYHENYTFNDENEWEDGTILAIEHLLAHFTGSLDMDEIVLKTGRKRTFFYKSFKSITGVTPNVFIQRLRIQMALDLLSRTSKPITEIAYDCGYQSLHNFNKIFHKYRNISPREYRKTFHK